MCCRRAEQEEHFHLYYTNELIVCKPTCIALFILVCNPSHLEEARVAYEERRACSLNSHAKVGHSEKGRVAYEARRDFSSESRAKAS